MVRTVKKVKVRHHAKFSQNCWNSGQNMAIFQDGGRRHVDFQNFKFLTVGMVKKIELHHCAKFCRNRLYHGRDVVIFDFQDGVRRHLRFSKSQIFNGRHARLSWICDTCVGTTHKGHLVIFITVQNLVEIDAVVLIICTFIDLTSLAWKLVFTSQNWGFWPLKWAAIWRKPQERHILARVRIIWAIMHKIRRRAPPVGEFRKKGINENNFGYISPIFPEAPVDGCAPILAQLLGTIVWLIWHSCLGRWLSHLWQIFWWLVEGCRFCRGSKIALSHWQSQSPLMQGRRYRAACDTRNPQYHFIAIIHMS